MARNKKNHNIQFQLINKELLITTNCQTMATKYISKINKIRIFICFYQNKDDKFNSNIFLWGGGRYIFVFKFKLGFFIFHLVYTSGSSIHLTWKCIFKDYSRSLKCLVKSTFPVWLLGANNKKMGENTRSQTLHKKEVIC